MKLPPYVLRKRESEIGGEGEREGGGVREGGEGERELSKEREREREGMEMKAEREKERVCVSEREN